MQDVLTKRSDSFQIVPIDIKNAAYREYESFSLRLVRVHHGIVPSIALKIVVDKKIIIISGDTNNENAELEKLAQNADLFVAHHAVSNSARGYAIELHMKPEMIAKIASKSRVKKVLLTHRMRRTIGKEKESLEVIKEIYNGEVVFAEDRMKLEL